MERASRQPSPLKAFLVVVGTCAVLSLNLLLPAQELAETELPIAPFPEAREAGLILAGRNTPSKPRKTGWLSAQRVSISVLIAGEALDSWTTYRNLTHHKWICGYSPAFGNAVTYISDDGKRYDQRTIQYDLCGAGPSGQLANYAYDVTRTGAFTETGWVRTLHLSGRRNVAGALAWNIADDIGYLVVARYVSKRRGWIGRMAPAINFTRGLVHIDCGIQNLQFGQTHNDANVWQFHIPNESTLYPGPRWWGRR